MAGPDIIYSVGQRLDGGGMGTSVVEMLIGLHQAGRLKQVIASSSKTQRLPATLITQLGLGGRVLKRLSLYLPRWWLSYVELRLYDTWASRVMHMGQVFSSWTGFCLSSLQVAKQRGMFTVLGLGSAHPQTMLDLLNAEAKRWGQPTLNHTAIDRQVEQELALADCIVVQSHFSAQSLVAHGIEATKIVRLPLGVNVSRFTPAPPPPPTPFRVLFLGQVMLRKGVQYLLEAWQHLHWPDAELWLAGRVTPEGQRVLATYGSLPGLKVLGYVPDQVAVMRQAHVLVMPSVEDGFGLVLLEAMACGLPVVVSANTGAADLLQNGASGFVVTYNDVQGYMHALETLRGQPQLRAVFSRAGQEVAQQQSWQNYRAALLKIYPERAA